MKQQINSSGRDRQPTLNMNVRVFAFAGSSYPRVEVDFVHVSMGEYARDLLQALEFNLTSPVTSTLILHR